MALFRVGFWNLYNLFEVGAVPKRGPQTPDELSGRIDRTAVAIAHFGADLLGICEIGSYALLGRLRRALRKLGYEYQVAFEDPALPTQTGLGILYRQGVFKHVFLRAVHRPAVQSRPRSVAYHCVLASPNETDFLLIVNHWKSRLPGPDSSRDRLESAHFVRQTLEREIARLPCIVLGDFNAEPGEMVFEGGGLPVVRYFNSVRGINLYSPMWRFWHEPGFSEDAFIDGYREPFPKTSQGDGNHLLDHIMVSKLALNGPSMRLLERSVEYYFRHGLGNWSSRGLLRPSPWVYDSNLVRSDGYSDHFPILANFEYQG
jgi:hypothetical protein